MEAEQAPPPPIVTEARPDRVLSYEEWLAALRQAGLEHYEERDELIRQARLRRWQADRSGRR